MTTTVSSEMLHAMLEECYAIDLDDIFQETILNVLKNTRSNK